MNGPIRSAGRWSRAVRTLAHGAPVLLIDDRPGFDEGHIVYAAEHATAALMAFSVRHTSGFVCVALDAATCDRLNLPPMWWSDRGDDLRHTVTVDAAAGIGTGISAVDRARTCTVLADRHAGPQDLTRPGHLVPVRAHDQADATAPIGPAEAIIDLLRAAGLRPAGVFSTLVGLHDPTGTAASGELVTFARSHHLPIVTVSGARAARLRARCATSSHAGIRHVPGRAALRDAEQEAVAPITRPPA